MNTVLITGCSSGFGLDAASCFLDRGWTVIASHDAHPAPRSAARPRITCKIRLPLGNVTDAGSIARAIDAAGPIDVLVNNAGVGMLGALEDIPMAKIRELIETNTLGTIAMTQAVLPQMREQGSGVIVNVTSGVTFQPLPLMSIYTASKAAVNAFTEVGGVGVGAAGHARAHRHPWPRPRDALRRQRARPHGPEHPRRLPGAGGADVRPLRGRRRRHLLARRLRGRVARRH